MKSIKSTLTACSVALILAGCNEAQVVAETCDAPISKNVDQAFNQSQATLSSQACWGAFDEHFDALLVTSSGDPSDENRKRFADWLSSAESRGIISRSQMKERYTRFFTPYFVELPRDESNCKAGQNLEQFTRNLDKEIMDKKRGLMDSMGSQEAYRKAIRDRDAIVLVVAAAAEACKA